VDDHLGVIRLATRKGILKEPTLGLVAELKRHWSVAMSTEPLTREAAVESLGAVRYILSILPAREPQPARTAGRAPESEAEIAHAS
jgi:hypothetical protein